MTTGDFDNDDKIDIVVRLCTGEQETVAFLKGDGTGGFAAATYSSPASAPPQQCLGYGYLAAADFNEDDNLDLITGTVGYYPSSILIYYGDGNGNFGVSTSDQQAIEPPNPSNFAPHGMPADMNNDGHMDIVGFDLAAMWDIGIYHGNGTGQFQTVQVLESGRTEDTVPAIADFNNDGFLDVNAGAFYYGDGTGLLRDARPGEGGLFSGPDPQWINRPAFGDFDEDGFLDLFNTDFRYYGGVSWNEEPNYVYYEFDGICADIVCPNDGPGSRLLPHTADLNQDGNLDVIVGRYFFLGDGAGNFIGANTLAGIQHDSVRQVVDLNGDGKKDIVNYEAGSSHPSHLANPVITIFINTTFQTPIGSHSSVVVGQTDFTFDEVTAGGTTTVTSIDPATAGDVPGGFALANVAFEVTTTATFSGEVTSCFTVSSVNIESEFLALRVLHNEGGTLVDRTSSHDFANRKICATTTSFSPFYLASVDKKVESLFDRSKAFRSGSTVPVKVRIRNSSDQNISAATLPLSVRGLRRIGAATASVVNDAGNSNPDYVFRYDSSLGGYIYNLKTTGLSAGKYVLSFYAGNDSTFLYTVTFDVR